MSQSHTVFYETALEIQVVPLHEVKLALGIGSLSQLLTTLGGILLPLSYTIHQGTQTVVLPLSYFGVPLLIIGICANILFIYRKYADWKRRKIPLTGTGSTTVASRTPVEHRRAKTTTITRKRKR